MSDQKMVSLPETNQLFKDSWATTKELALRYIFWQIILFFVIIAVIIGLGIAGLILYAISEALLIPLIVIGIFLFLVIVIWFGTVSSLLVIKHPEKPSYSELLAEAKTKLVPLGTASLIGLLIGGSFFLFIIPGIIACFFISLAGYEILTKQTSAMAAIKRSVSIWQTHTKYLFKNFVILTLISLAANIFFNAFNNDGGTESLAMTPIILVVALLQLVYNFLMPAFSMVFSYRLYQETSAKTPADVQARMTWIWVTSALGWAIGAFALVGLIGLLQQFATQIPWNDIQKMIQEQAMQTS